MDYVKIMRDLREDADLTQEQVARMLGTSQTMYARYERGANELPLRHAIALCKFYKVSADYFLGLDEEKKAPPPNVDKTPLLTPDSLAALRRFERFLLCEQQDRIGRK